MYMVEPIGFEPIHQWNRVTAGFDSPTSTGLQDTLFRMCIVKQTRLFPVGFLGPPAVPSMLHYAGSYLRVIATLSYPQHACSPMF